MHVARRRAAALVVAALTVVPAAWFGIRALGGLGGERAPAYPLIGPANVSRLSVAWQTRTEGISGPSLTADGGAAYVGTTSGDLVAFDPVDGSTKWTARVDGFITSKPAVAGGRVYAHTSSGTLYAFPNSCRTPCTPLWTAQTGSLTSTPPTIGGGSLYVVSDQGRLLAFPVDCGTGGAVCQPAWTAETGQHLPVEVAVASGVVWDSSSTRLLPFDANCGTSGFTCSPLTKGFQPKGSALSGPPAVAGGVVYVGGSDGSLYAIASACSQDPAECHPLWVGRTGGAIVSAPVSAGGVVYVGSNDGNVYAYPARCRTDGSTCEPTWFGRTGDPIGQSPAVAGSLVFLSSSETVYAFATSRLSTGQRDYLARVALGSRTLGAVVWNDRVVLVPTRSAVLFGLAVPPNT